MPDHQVIHIHVLAPAKPGFGAACNGCGVCCLVQPCPLGVLLSLRFKGPCKALQWSSGAQRYHCGALAGANAPSGPPTWRARWVARWIAAGVGCDCSLDVVPAPTMPAPHQRPD